MKEEDKEQLSPLESSILSALQSVDEQIALETERSPAEAELRGVDSSEIYRKRVEFVASFLIGAVQAEQVQLDSLVVFSQAFMKALAMTLDDKGIEGLKNFSAKYAVLAAKSVEKDAYKVGRMLLPAEDQSDLS